MAEFDFPDLPLTPHLPALRRIMAERRVAVLRADPGSGKSTLVPLALMPDGPVLVLEPRRVAAAAVASRMADLLGEPLGRRIGFAVRGERRTSAATVVEVVTEGLLTRRLQDDPGLNGAATVIFDEFHERSIHTDLALALLLDLRRLRPELGILVMSATMDGDALTDFLAKADGRPVPLVDCPGRPFPVEIIYRPIRSGGWIGPAVASAIADELDVAGAPPGDVLAFLPGKREIADASAELGRRLADRSVDILQLHGGLPLAEQRRVTGGRSASAPRRVVLATNIAETSLTVPGVNLVVDSGLVRLQRLHVASQLDRLVLENASQASTDQRAGRAGRLGPGRCVRLWAAGAVRTPATEPEIRRSDLAGLVLDCALWGARRPDDLLWLDPPPPAAWQAASELLAELGALSADGAPTDRGRRMARLGTAPRLAALVLSGEFSRDGPALAVLAAAVLAERDEGVKRDDCDFRERLAQWRRGAAQPGDQVSAGTAAWRRRVGEAARDLLGRLGASAAAVGLDWPVGAEADSGGFLAAAFPDRIARRQSSGAYRFSSGREATLAGTLENCEWLVAVEAEAGERSGSIRLAAPLAQEQALAILAPRIGETIETVWDGLAPRAVRRRTVGRLVLAEYRTKLAADELAAAFAAELAARGLEWLPWGDANGSARQLAERWRFGARYGGAAIPVWDEAVLIAAAADLFGPSLVSGGGPAVDPSGVSDSLRRALGGRGRAELDRQVPERFRTPAGTMRPLEYANGEVALEARIQELFGLAATPTILGQPVLVHLLSPAGRPLQITRDLAGFWRATYAEVRKEMRGRYPRHSWPEDPTAAVATARAKPRKAR